MATHLTSCGGTAQVVVVGVLLFVCTVLEIVALGGSWWTDNGEKASVHVSLWEVEVTPREGVVDFPVLNLNWDEYCAHEKIDKADWCHKIRAVRSMAFLALGLHFFALFSLIVAAMISNKRWGICAIGCLAVGTLCAFICFMISLFYPTETAPAVNEPGSGFVSMLCGALLGLSAVILSCCGIARSFMKSRGSDGPEQEWTTWRPQGSAYPIIVSLLVMVAVFAEGIALIGTWWIDSHTLARVQVTLWRVVVTSQNGDFEDLSLNWSEYCSHEKIDKEDWCHMIRAVRSTTILATMFVACAFTALVVSLARKSNIWGKIALVNLFLSLSCGMCGFSVSLFYPANTAPAVDTPGFAFVMCCFSALLSLLAIILIAFRMLRFSSAGFQQLEGTADAGEPKKYKVEPAVPNAQPNALPLPPKTAAPTADEVVSPTSYGVSPKYVSETQETFGTTAEGTGGQPYVSEAYR